MRHSRRIYKCQAQAWCPVHLWSLRHSWRICADEYVNRTRNPKHTHKYTNVKVLGTQDEHTHEQLWLCYSPIKSLADATHQSMLTHTLPLTGYLHPCELDTCWPYPPEYADTHSLLTGYLRPLELNMEVLPRWCYPEEYVDTHLTTDWLPAPLRTRQCTDALTQSSQRICALHKSHGMHTGWEKKVPIHLCVVSILAVSVCLAPCARAKTGRIKWHVLCTT